MSPIGSEYRGRSLRHQPDSDAPSNDVALALKSISLRFGSTIALDSASFSARRGTVHALLGENGAGKTTLMGVAFGLLRADSGTVSVNNVERAFRSPSDAIAAGVGMVHQHFALISSMTVVENILLGRRGALDTDAARRQVRAVALRTGLEVDPYARVDELGVGAQQRVEIIKALVRSAAILILDEPTSVLTPLESRELLTQLRRLVESGTTIVLITHKLKDALEFADDITVLRRGRTTWSGRSRDTDEAGLLTAMLGSAPASDPSAIAAHDPSNSHFCDAHPGTAGKPVLELLRVNAVDIRGVRRLHDVSIKVHAGEILGIAAVEGNGQRELLRIMAGRLTVESGTVTAPPVVGFVPEDRHRDAVIGPFSLIENTTLFGAGVRTGKIDWSSQRKRTARMLSAYDVRTPSVDAAIQSLSGGNQQKLVLGRELEGSRLALVVENPSRGLDVQATDAIHNRLRSARDAGMAIVMYSSDIDEVIAMADRVVVLHQGRVREVDKERGQIGSAMLGVNAS